MPTTFNNRLRQIVLLLIIGLLAFLLLKEFAVFLPGFLGAITLYILLREYFFSLTLNKRWNKTGTAIFFISFSILIIALPLYFSIQLLSTKISDILSNPVDLMMKAKIVGEKLYGYTGVLTVFTTK